MPWGRCADCGYLAVRDKRTRQLVEAESKVRRKGELPPTVEPQPLCFVRAADLPAEVGESPVDYHILACVERNRDCPGFLRWDQGFTPREHKEREDGKADKERQMQADLEFKKWQQEESRKNEEHRQKLYKRDSRWRRREQERSREQDRQEHRRFLWQLAVGVVATALLLGGGTVLAAWIQANAAWEIHRDSQPRPAAAAPAMPPAGD